MGQPHPRLSPALVGHAAAQAGNLGVVGDDQSIPVGDLTDDVQFGRLAEGASVGGLYSRHSRHSADAPPSAWPALLQRMAISSPASRRRDTSQRLIALA